VEQILNNLVSNAIKYGAEKPEVIVECRDEGEHSLISVSDNGIGISHEDQRKLFAEFERIGQDHSIPGTGLGLWLTNTLVQAHGGKMGVESQPGEGSTFSFTLPHAPSDAFRRKLKKGLEP
jgi:signal transduction histidine kinase